MMVHLDNLECPTKKGKVKHGRALKPIDQGEMMMKLP